MSPLDRPVLAERTSAVRRHLARVAQRLPPTPTELQADTDASDVVILHLWQATQIVIDLAVSACIKFDCGSPRSYGDAFRLLEQGKVIDRTLADRLVKAAGFRNIVAHAYGTLDMKRVHRAATEGPRDLLVFVAALDAKLGTKTD